MMESSMTPETLLEKISSEEAEVRSDGWLNAAQAGVAAIRPLAAVIAQMTPVVATLAKELAVLERAGLDEAVRDQIVAKQAELRQPLEVSRAAKRGLWQIVRHAARPGAGEEKETAVSVLVELLEPSQPLAVRREAIALLAELGTDQAVEAIAERVEDEDLYEEACKALERIPTRPALAALQMALETVAEPFRPHVVRALRARGMELPDRAGQD